MSTEPVLEVESLILAAKSKEILVNNVSFSLGRGESLGLVGESGSGKSLTLRAILGILPRGVEQTGGTVRSKVSSAMVFQDPRGALDPLCLVVKQLAEVVYYRQQVSRRAARTIALELLERLGLPDSLRKRTAIPASCQAASVSVLLSHWLLPVSPAFFSAMSRQPPWTSPFSGRSSTRSPVCSVSWASPWSSLHTIWQLPLTSAPDCMS